MAGETTRLKLPYPSESDNINEGATKIKELAEKLDKLTVAVEASGTPSFLSWGAISQSGSIEASSGDFTVAKVTTGVYEVKWSTAKSSANYALSAMALIAVPAGLNVTFKNRLTTSVIFETWNASSKESTAFSFTAVAGS